MKNIYDILKSVGIEVPSDKKEAFDKAVAENYKTVNEVENLRSKLSNMEDEKKTLSEQYDADVKQRDKDLKDLQKQLKEAGEDKTKLEALQADVTKWQNDYNNSKQEYEKKLASQQYEFAIKERANALKFSSNSARKAFISDLMQNPLQVKDGNVLGFDDFVNEYKKQDEGAFITETSVKKDNPAPQFSSKSGKDESGSEGSKDSTPKERPLIW